MAAILDRDILILDIAGDACAALHGELADADRAFDRAGDPGAFCGDGTDDVALGPLDQRGAIDVALDPALDMQFGAGVDVPGDHDIGADHGKHAAPTIAVASGRQRHRRHGEARGVGGAGRR